VHFPAGCPPKDADDLGGTVYLLVETNPPTAKDMECAIDRGSFVGKCECQRASLSCARDSDHLRALRGTSKRLRRHLIAKGALNAEHGKIKQTGGAGHYSMWLRTKWLSVGHTLFRVQP
jgi:hypothetical protein